MPETQGKRPNTTKTDRNSRTLPQPTVFLYTVLRETFGDLLRSRRSTRNLREPAGRLWYLPEPTEMGPEAYQSVRGREFLGG